MKLITFILIYIKIILNIFYLCLSVRSQSTQVSAFWPVGARVEQARWQDCLYVTYQTAHGDSDSDLNPRVKGGDKLYRNAFFIPAHRLVTLVLLFCSVHNKKGQHELLVDNYHFP